MNVPSTSSLWIGLKKNPFNSKYEWADGSPLEYTDFSINSPTSECVYMYSNKWYDVDCLANRFRYVCKRAKSNNFLIIELA